MIGIATLIGHFIPLVPFIWLPRQAALITAIVLAGFVLFGVGVYSAVTLVGDWRKNGAQMVVIGLFSVDSFGAILPELTTNCSVKREEGAR